MIANIFKRDNGLLAIYTTHAIDALAFSISAIFIPIFFLNQGYEVRDVLLYFIVHNIVLVGFAFIAGKLAEKIGLKKVILFRYPFLFIFLILLIYWSQIDINICYLAVTSGIQAAFFWMPLNVLFARQAKTEKMDSAVGKLLAVSQLAGLIAPITGGLIVAILGFKTLFIVIFIISIFSFIPIALSKVIKSDYQFKPKRGFIFFKKNPKLLFAEIADNIGGETEGG